MWHTTGLGAGLRTIYHYLSIKSGYTFMYKDDNTVFCIGPSQDVACNLLEELFTWSLTITLLYILVNVRYNVTFQSSAY